MIDGRPIIKSNCHVFTKTLKHICLRDPNTPDVNDTVTFITPFMPYDRPLPPLVSVTLAFWISQPDVLVTAAIRALTTFVCM